MRRSVYLYILRRFLESLFVLWVIITILFFFFRLAPGNPLAAYIDTTFTEEQQASLMSRFGLDRPLYMQYLIYLGNVVQGDLGDSFFRGESVVAVISEALPNTL
ncbi:MAG: ABC transporter permease, partial [Chloroflexota bacterium]